MSYMESAMQDQIDGSIALQNQICDDACDVYKKTHLMASDLLKQRAELLEALNALFSNEHVELGDLIYTVREREGNGWGGEWVNHWSTSVSKAKELLTELGQ